MATRIATVKKNADGTWTVRVGRQVEHVDPHGKSRGEIFDAIRWALISKGINLDEVNVVELMQEES
jgi:hypothetical protein